MVLLHHKARGRERERERRASERLIVNMNAEIRGGAVLIRNIR
jgi:hypothetical protein